MSSTRIVIVVGKSCETDIVLSPILSYFGSGCRVITSSLESTHATSCSVGIFTDVELFEHHKDHYPTSVIIVTEVNAYRLKTIPEGGVYTIAYNTDKVSVSLRVLLLAKSMTLPSLFTRTSAVSMIGSTYKEVMVWSRQPITFELPSNVTNSVMGDVVCREVSAILFYDTPSCDEYYDFVRRVIKRSNYKDRAKSGVNVKVYLLAQNTARYDVDRLLQDIAMRISSMKALVQAATKQLVVPKGGGLSFEDRFVPNESEKKQ